MINFFSIYQSLFDHILVNMLFAASQYVVLRAGVFSLGSAGFAALGAYCTALLTTKLGWNPWLGVLAGTLLGTFASVLLALPLSRLRGVFQAVATLAFVQIVLTITQNWVSFTGGPMGVNSIPHATSTLSLLGVVVVVVAFLVMMGRYSFGRALDVIREDETVAVSLGISVPYYHRIAFILSGALAGLSGGLHALSSYSITPQDYGFGLLVAGLTMVVLGGRTTVWGALVGAAVLTSLPEIFRLFADYRSVVQGVLLMLVIIYLPRGVADTVIAMLKDRRLRRKQAASPAPGLAPAPAASAQPAEAGARS